MSPYITPGARLRINKHGIDGVGTAGELNYFLTRMILEYLGNYPKYKDFNEVLGVLTAIPLELYRRKIADYEDDKKERNGDVY
jgi:hypothetical protein